MKIISLELFKYKRFLLSQIEKFKINLTESLQLILGPNGSGKSSLIKQLNPLPPNKEDFDIGGYKIIHIEFNNNTYILSSFFDKKQKHSFLLNNEELNIGNTVTIQKDLVKEHFNITSEIIDMILEKGELFTNMSPSKRKDWFIRLSDANYDYALKVYNSIKDKHRDILGAIKIAKKQVNIETEKILKTNEEEKIIKEKDYLLDILNQLLEVRKPVENNILDLQNKDSLIDLKINRIKLEIDELELYLNNSKDTLESIDYKLINVNTEINIYIDRINQLTNYLNELDNKIEILKKADNNSIADIDNKLNNFIINKKNLIEDSIIKKEIKYEDGTFFEIKNILLDIFSNIPNNKDKIYSSELLQTNKEKYDLFILDRDKKMSSLNHFENKLEHILKHKNNNDINCPKCNHSFSINYSEKLENEYKLTIETFNEQIKNLNNQIDIVKDYLDRCNNYSYYYKEYNKLCKTNLIFLDYFNYLNNLNIISKDPDRGIYEINKIENDLLIQKQISILNENIENLENLKKQLSHVGDSNIKILEEDKNIKSKDLTIFTEELNNKKYNKNILLESKKRYLKLNTILDNLKNLIDEKKLNTKNLVETHRRQILNDLIKDLQLELVNRENSLNIINTSKINLNNIVVNIDKLEEQQKVLEIILNNLSPTEGLIAEGLYNFINYFISEMNHFISKIWSYDLVIEPCSLDINSDTGLDYRFPVRINNTNIINDINKGSDGIVEIINVAFRITALKHLNLLNYPFYLDEFGYSFDASHKANSVLIIKSLLEQNIFKQLFLISHDYGQYGGLSNCEICSFELDNLNIPILFSKVNKHVYIERA